jgi:outer membrane protein assembly factor BamB
VLSSHQQQPQMKSAVHFLLAAALASTCAYVWPMSGFDSAHTLASSFPGPSRANTSVAVRWGFTNNTFHQSTPVVGSNGVIYAVSSDGSGVVVALNGSTGSLLWQIKTPLGCAYTQLSSGTQLCAPVLSRDEKLLFVSGGPFFALRTRDGRMRWKLTLSALTTSAPTRGPDGTLFVATNTSLAAIKPTAYHGYVLWEVPMGGAIQGTPAVSGSVVVVGVSGTNALLATDAATGAQLWNEALYYIMTSSPAISNGLVFIGDGYTVRASNLSTGALVWVRDTAMYTAYSSPAVYNHHVFIGNGNGILFALDANTGVVTWQTSLGAGWVVSAPSVGSSGVVYGGTDAARLSALDAETGEILWFVHWDILNSAPGTPVIDETGALIVGTSAGLFALGQ